MILEDVCELIVDTEHKTAPRQETGYPSIRTPNIGRGRFLLEGVYRVSQETYEKWTRRAIPVPGDLILAREAPVGNVAVIPEDLQPCLGQRTVLIRPKNDFVFSRFLCYYLLSKEMQDLIASLSSGATVPHLNMKDIRGLELGELPPISRQKKIASILSAYDDLIENNLKRIKLLEEAAQHLYKEWFVDYRFPGSESMPSNKETGLPAGWVKKNINEVYEIKYGKNLPKTMIKEHGKFPVYGASGVMGYYDKSNTQGKVALITSRGNGSGDVLRTFHSQSFVTNNSFVVKPKSSFENFPFFYTTEFLKRLNLKNYCSGSAQPQLTNTALKNIEAYFPPQDLIEVYARFMSPLFSQFDVLLNQNTTLKDARDLLLPRLMNRTIEV